jgi:hypothetical protein
MLTAASDSLEKSDTSRRRTFLLVVSETSPEL